MKTLILSTLLILCSFSNCIYTECPINNTNFLGNDIACFRDVTLTWKECGVLCHANEFPEPCLYMQILTILAKDTLNIPHVARPG